VRFGLYGLHKGENTEPGAFAARARRAEEVGFESIWVGDHIALPFDAPDDPRVPRIEALIALAHLAAVTERVKLGCGVIVLPQRQPVLLAKQLASIDLLSHGRLIVGLGAGYVERELNALGSTLQERGARMDEYIAAMKALWDEPTPRFSGRFVEFAEVLQRPRPTQLPHPPLTIGGHGKAAIRRAKEAGGWYGWELTPDEIPADVAGLELTITPPMALDEAAVAAYADKGVDRVVVQPTDTTGATMDALIERIATLVAVTRE
jgi:probable F420-dependent oxidoreductase